MGLTQKQRDLKAAKTAARAAAAAEEAARTDGTDPQQQRKATLETAARIVRALGEEQYHARLQVLRCVRLLGQSLALELLAEALRIDGDGGELLPGYPEGGRYRTPGGIFFRLAHSRVTPEEWARIVPGHGEAR